MKLGDMVIYSDQDQIQWGPWKVVDVLGDIVTVAVEERIQCPINVSRLRKIQNDREVVYS